MVFETVRSILFYCDTRLRSSGSIGTPVFQFPNNLIQKNEGDRMQLTMQEASIAYTFYQTELYNNSFMLTERLGTDPPVYRLISVPIGNYNLETFVAALTVALNGITTFSLFVWTVTHIPATNLLVYVATVINPAVVCTAEFNFNSTAVNEIAGFDIRESMHELMGFPQDSVITLTQVNPAVPLTCTSTLPITMSGGVTNLYVTLQNSCSNFGQSRTGEANIFSGSNILAKIPIPNPPFSTLYFYDINSNFATIIDNTYLDNLTLTLFNDRFTAIEPRKDWTFTIKIDILQESSKNRTADAMEKLLSLQKLEMLNNQRK